MSKASTVSIDDSGNFEHAPICTTLGRCFKIVDIGTQRGEYMGEPTKKRQIIVSFELPTKLMSDGRPFVVSRFWTRSLHKNADFRKDLESWRGGAFTEEELKAFDIEKILSKPCMLSIVAKGGGKEGVKIGAITGVPDGITVPPQVNPSFSFWIGDWNQEKFETLTDGVKGLIKRSDEYKAMVGGGSAQVPAAAVAGGSSAAKAPF